MILNDWSLFVEKHIFNDGTHIRHSPAGIDDVSVSAKVTKTKFENVKKYSVERNRLNLNDELFPLISAAHWCLQAVCSSSNCARCTGLDV